MYGDIVRKTCFRCGKRRLCRIDNMNRYYTAEASGKLIPVCLQECSRFEEDRRRKYPYSGVR